MVTQKISQPTKFRNTIPSSKFALSCTIPLLSYMSQPALFRFFVFYIYIYIFKKKIWSSNIVYKKKIGLNKLFIKKILKKY